jgi:hypothetical protein
VPRILDDRSSIQDLGRRTIELDRDERESTSHNKAGDDATKVDAEYLEVIATRG